MSKLPNVLRIVSAPNGGFIVQNDDFKPLAAFSSPVDLIGWLSRNLMPDVSAAMSGPLTGEAKPAGRLESAVLAKLPVSTADLDQADRFPRAVQSRRPVPPPEGDGP